MNQKTSVRRAEKQKSSPAMAIKSGQKGPKGKSKTNKSLIILMVSVFVILLASAYGVYAWYTNTPDYMLNRAIAQQASSSSFAAKLDSTVSSAGIALSIKGDLAMRLDPNNSKNLEAILNVGSGNDRAGFTIANFGNKTYLKANGLQNLGSILGAIGGAQEFFGSGDALMSARNLDNVWYNITQKDLKNMQYPKTPAELFTDYGKLEEIYWKHPFIKPDKIYNDEMVNRIDSAHFSLKIDAAAYKEFLKELKSANLKSFNIKDSEIRKADKELQDMAKKATFEVWVARNTKMFSQFKVTIGDKHATTTFLLTTTAYPNQQPLQEPTNAKPISQFYKALFGPTHGTLTEAQNYRSSTPGLSPAQYQKILEESSSAKYNY